MLDDLEDAGNRVRRKRSHRLRNALLMLAGIAGIAFTLPKIRSWLTESTGVFETSLNEPDPIA